MEKESNFISVVAYVGQDAGQTEDYLDRVMRYIALRFVHCELILVLDGDAGESARRIRAYYAANKPGYMVTLLRMGLHQGQESAMNAGRDLAIGDFVFEFDDLYVDYEPEVVYEAYERSLSGYDIVTVGADAKMRLTSRIFYRVFNAHASGHASIGQATFRLLSRRAINRVKSIGSHIPYRKALYMNSGLKVAEITYHTTDAVTRHTRNDERMGLAVDSFIYFTDVMERISIAITLLFLLLGAAVLIYVGVSFFTDEHLVSGWVSMMGFLSLAFMGVFGMLSIILKYLSVIMNLIFRKQHYLVEEIEKLERNV